MKTIDEYIRKRREDHDAWLRKLSNSPIIINQLTPSGIACPFCSSELLWNKKIYGDGPFAEGIECKCGANGHIDAIYRGEVVWLHSKTTK